MIDDHKTAYLEPRPFTTWLQVLSYRYKHSMFNMAYYCIYKPIENSLSEPQSVLYSIPVEVDVPLQNADDYPYFIELFYYFVIQQIINYPER